MLMLYASKTHGMQKEFNILLPILEFQSLSGGYQIYDGLKEAPGVRNNQVLGLK